MHTTRKCTDCPRTLVSGRRWKAASTEQRQQWQAADTGPHYGRGMCSSCYDAARAAGTLVDRERATVPLEDVLDSWQHLSDERAGLSRAQACRQLAPRMGMSPAALEKALTRAAAMGVAA